MNFLEKIIAAYYYYKGQYNDSVVMFRYNDHYHALFCDARIVSNALGIDVTETVDTAGLTLVQLPLESIFDYIDELSLFGIKVMLIEYRNNFGEFDIPDVSLIDKEKTEDY